MTRSALGLSAIVVLAGACGSSGPTKQLTDARQAMQMAQASGTAQMAPNRMQDAQAALDQAERAHKDDPGSNTEANLAYIAKRKAEIAMASGKTVASMHKEDALNQQYQAKLAQTANSQRQQLRAQALQQQRQQAAQASQSAETRAADALQSLSEVATVKHEQKGTVITLMDAALFQTGADTLSDDARSSLDKVASALEQQPKDTQIRIEGYTDASGSTASNEALSQRRADAVRKYLEQRGVDGSMLESIGRGEANPVASNSTDDGRASNRRAEIVVKVPENETSPGMPPAPGAPSKNTRPNSSAKSPPEPQK